MPNNQKCPICNGQLLTISSCQARTGLFCYCARCGRYEVADGLLHETDEKFVMDEKLKSSMYYFLTQIRKEQRKEDTRTVRFDLGEIGMPEILEHGSLIYVSQAALFNIFPNDMDDQVSMILVNFSNLCESPGDPITSDLPLHEMSHLFFLKGEDQERKSTQISWWIKTLTDLGYIHLPTRQYYLTLKGWKRATDYAKAQAKSKTVFVAMSFADELLIAREEIKRAIESSGFVPMLIDTKEHNNQIVPEILYEIRKSRFVVADFTNQRCGVYYEAGYAEGLNIPVIALCREDDFENVHFDLKQKNTIQWKSPGDIYHKLKKRIEATLDLR